MKTPEVTPYDDVSTIELVGKLAMFGSMKTGFLNNVLLPMLDKAASWDNSIVNNFLEFALKHTAIKIFFGGVGIDETKKTAEKLLSKKIGVILDYAAPEGNDTPTQEVFDAVRDEYQKAIEACKELKARFSSVDDGNVSLAVKLSTLMPFEDMEKISKKLEKNFDGATLDDGEKKVLGEIQDTVNALLAHAKENGVSVYIDAEQTYINAIIRKVCFDALEEGHALNVTVQAYLKDTVERVGELLAMTEDRPDLGKRLGVKLVRGAYIGEDREKGKIWHSGPEDDPHYDGASKENTDNTYGAAFERLYKSGRFGLITVATHNEESLRLAAQIMEEERSNFTQVDSATLLGMGDILPSGGIPRAKYVPYPDKGNVLGTVAYFSRRGTEFMGQEGKGGITRGEQEFNAAKDALLSRLPRGVRESVSTIIAGIDKAVGVTANFVGRFGDREADATAPSK